MSFSTSNDYVVSISPKDSDWFFSIDGISIIPRASVTISSNCPTDYRMMVQHALENNWIEVCAHVRHKHLVWDRLSGD